MAKKKTGSRKTASRGARKGGRKSARTAARPAGPARAATPHISATLTRRKGKNVSDVTWNPGPSKVNLTPLKAIIEAHINQLSKVSPTDEVTKTLNTLQHCKTELLSICGLSMEIPTRSEL